MQTFQCCLSRLRYRLCCHPQLRYLHHVASHNFGIRAMMPLSTSVSLHVARTTPAFFSATSVSPPRTCCLSILLFHNWLISPSPPNLDSAATAPWFDTTDNVGPQLCLSTIYSSRLFSCSFLVEGPHEGRLPIIVQWRFLQVVGGYTLRACNRIYNRTVIKSAVLFR